MHAWNITKVWGRKPGNRVIDDLDLTLEPGTLTWIGGSNGVGKTTLLRVLAGLIGPTEGHVHMFGLHPEHDRRAYQQRLSFLPATSTVVRQCRYWQATDKLVCSSFAVGGRLVRLGAGTMRLEDHSMPCQSKR